MEGAAAYIAQLEGTLCGKPKFIPFKERLKKRAAAKSASANVLASKNPNVPEPAKQKSEAKVHSVHSVSLRNDKTVDTKRPSANVLASECPNVLEPAKQTSRGKEHSVHRATPLGNAKMVDAKQPSPKFRVRWGIVMIQEYSAHLGGSGVPSQGGPPITLGNRIREHRECIDRYEMRRSQGSEVRRSREVYPAQGFLPPALRSDWLRNAGYSSDEVEQASEEVACVLKQRGESCQQGNGTQKRASHHRISQQI